MLQQPPPLRRPPSSPLEVAQSVHGKVLQMTELAAAPVYDIAKIQTMLRDDAAEVRCCHAEHTGSVQQPRMYMFVTTLVGIFIVDGTFVHSKISVAVSS